MRTPTLFHPKGRSVEICHAGKDPFSINWGGELWFGKDDGSGWILGETEAGGENQLQIECP